jgi:hypothetical protein
MTSRARRLSQAVRDYLLKVTGLKQRREKRAAAGVFLHDPGAEGPHDLDDPFYDRKAQARIGEAISSATQKK